MPTPAAGPTLLTRVGGSFTRCIEGGRDAGQRRDLRDRPPLQLEQAAETLAATLATGDESARRRVRAHVPRLADFTDDVLTERATIADARLVIAREHGFPTWIGLIDGLRKESEDWQRARQHSEPIAAALAAIRDGDAARLKTLLDTSPSW